MPIHKLKKTMHGNKTLGQRGHVPPKPLPATLTEKSLLGTKHILFLLGIKHSTFYEWRAAGKFPPPDRSKGFNYWAVPTILAHLKKYSPDKAVEFAGKMTDGAPHSMGMQQAKLMACNL